MKKIQKKLLKRLNEYTFDNINCLND